MINDADIMEFLGKAFADGEIDALAEILSPDCAYVSQPANRSLWTASEILSGLKEIYSCVTDESRYSYQVVPLAGLLINGCSGPVGQDPSELNDYALLLYRYDLENPYAVVSAEVDRNSGLVKSILLSRDPIENGFLLSGLKGYLESAPYTEPEKCDELLYEDGRRELRRIWRWDIKAAYMDRESGLLKILLSGRAFNYKGVSTFAALDGERLTSMDFDYIDDFIDGLALVAKRGCGYGFVDERMRFIIPMMYEKAEKFIRGKAKVMRGGDWYFIDKAGRETLVKSKSAENPYQEIGVFSEGLCKVSTLKLRFPDLAYHSDYESIAGIWGFVNEAGEEVIAPQYIYAEDFSGGVAIVCEGKWTIGDSGYNKGRYWSDEERWGAIDREGHTAIPFVFDEIKSFWNVDGIFIAHYGGWEDGSWGVIDSHGNWLAEPMFGDVDYKFQDGMFAFICEDEQEDEPLYGIYDISQRKVLFEPNFYDVDFLDNGLIKVAVYDESLGRRIEKLIDRQGNEKFPSVYSSIYTFCTPYEVAVESEEGRKAGLIDEHGKVLLPCEYDTTWNGICYEAGRMVFIDGKKQGVRDFSGNVLVPAVYSGIYSVDKPFFIVRVGTERDHKVGLITETGAEVLPCVYQSMSWYDNTHLLCEGENGYEMLLLTEKCGAEIVP